MKIDFKAMIQDIKKPKSDRQRVSMYVSEQAYDDFRGQCERVDVSPSEVIERLMREFSEYAKSLPAPAKKKKS